MLQEISERLTYRKHEADEECSVHHSDTEGYRPDYWNPTHEYFLRGVALTSDLSYVCTREEPSLIDYGEEPKLKDQWWKMLYSANEPSPAKVEVCCKVKKNWLCSNV
jgi:hypothetical protein